MQLNLSSRLSDWVVAYYTERPYLVISRRTLLLSVGFLAAELLASPSRLVQVYAQTLQPFQLHLVRDQKLVDVLGYRRCVLGKLFVVSNIDAPIAAAQPLAHTLELPYLGNQQCISAIPEGRYSGSVLQDGEPGWRIAINGVPGRRLIRIHTGNVTSEIEGCILIGRVSDSSKEAGRAQ